MSLGGTLKKNRNVPISRLYFVRKWPLFEQVLSNGLEHRHAERVAKTSKKLRLGQLAAILQMAWMCTHEKRIWGAMEPIDAEVVRL